MKIMKISAVICALTAATAMTISASAAKDLTPTDTAHKFDLGSDDVGGSGVEPNGSESGQNWIKVVQSSNPGLKLFDDVGPEVNVTALAVTFEISEWSGTEFSVSWGANIGFFDDASTTWCGTDAFSKISEYTITGDGEYTLVCDLEAMTSAQGKEGISHLQTCEMVIGNVATGDTTQIEVKSARITLMAKHRKKLLYRAATMKVSPRKTAQLKTIHQRTAQIQTTHRKAVFHRLKRIRRRTHQTQVLQTRLRAKHLMEVRRQRTLQTLLQHLQRLTIQMLIPVRRQV